MNLTSSIALTAAAVLPADKKPTKPAEAAEQFEALMIGELLKSAEGDRDTWLGDDADDASETAMGMAETQLAQAMASHGGFGMAHMIERIMDRTASTKAAPDASKAAIMSNPEGPAK
jgi:Rod binding domain-containing protein